MLRKNTSLGMGDLSSKPCSTPVAVEPPNHSKAQFPVLEEQNWIRSSPGFCLCPKKSTTFLIFINWFTVMVNTLQKSQSQEVEMKYFLKASGLNK